MEFRKLGISLKNSRMRINFQKCFIGCFCKFHSKNKYHKSDMRYSFVVLFPYYILANCLVFGEIPLFSLFYWLIFTSVPILHEISPLFPAYLIICILLSYCVPPCPAKLNARLFVAQVGMYCLHQDCALIRSSGFLTTV